MASMVEQAPDSKLGTPARHKVRHAYCACQDTKPIQTALCGHTEPGRKLIGSAPTTIPDGACVVCLDLRSEPRRCCGGGF